MASMSVATIAADQVTGGGGAQAGGDQTSGGQTGELHIQDSYVAKPQSRLPIPDVLDKYHLSEIEKSNETDRKFWTIQYGAARGFQTTQTKILRTLETEEMERQKDISAFKTGPKELLLGPTRSARQLRLQFEEQVAKLEEVNNTIASTNLAAERNEFFGQVHTYGLVEPKLNDQDDFKSIVTQTPELQRVLAKPYRKASELQHYHLNYMNATKEGTRDKSIETRILDELNETNDEIDILVRTTFRELLAAERIKSEQELKRSQDGKVSKEQKRDLDQKYRSAAKKIGVCCLVYVPNEGEDDYTLDEALEDDIDSDNESLMSGVNDQPHIEEPGDGEGGQSKKQPLPKEIEDIRARMGGREGPLFTYICDEIFSYMTKEAKQEVEEQLAGLRHEVDAYCDSKSINRATYAITDTHIQAFTSMVKDSNDSIILLKVNINDAKLHDKYKLLRQSAKLFIQEHQWPESFLDTFVPAESEIVKLAAEHAAQNPPAPAQNPPAPAQNAPPSAETEAPPAEDTDEQCIVSVSIPGVVEEMEDGILRQKRVANIRPCGRGHQLALKSYGRNPDFKNRFIYELVPARSFAGALQEFQAMHPNTQINTVPRKDLKDQPWRQVLVGGVMSPRREVEKLYKIQATTLVNIKFPGTAFMWASQDNLSKEFGENSVQAKINQYRMESGQKAPKAPTERVFRQSKKELEAQLKALSLSEDAQPRRKKATKEEAGMTRTRKYKKKTPLKSAHPKSKTAFPETDGEEEEEGDSVADGSERSGEESDSGSM